jgi:inhibitor of KinA sporulation pathway (predicted exonuclease)
MAALKMSHRYLCVLDFEATCIESPDVLEPLEIIEFPSVLLAVSADAKVLTVMSEFQSYVKPKANPTLTPFCTQLTGITQSIVDGGVPFLEALASHTRWLADSLGEAPTSDNILFVTCGDWDLKTMMPIQCQVDGIEVPTHFYHWINIKKLLWKQFKESRAIVSNMGGLLKFYELDFIGRPHSGIDDCRNIARACLKFAETGGRFEATSKRSPES